MRERDGALAVSSGLLERVRTGRGGGSLFIVGEAGLGKTVLLEHARRLAGEGFAVGLGQGDPLEASLPFALVAQALAGLGGEEALNGGSPSPATGEGRTARFYAILRRLEQVRRPTLLLLDDLHCADPDSLALVSFLCRRLGEGRVAVIGTLRPWPAPAADLASTLAHTGHTAVERLLPLGTEAARGFLAERIEQPVSPETLERISDLCAGNPLLLEQAALALDRGDDVVTAAASPHRLIDRYLLLGRFAGLPPAGLRWAQAASVLGTRFRPELVTGVGRLGDEGNDAVEALWRSGLVRDGEGDLAEFVHPLFREAVYDDLPPPLRTSLHRRAFEVLAARGLEAEAAEHALAASPADIPDATALLERVGRRALRAGTMNAAARCLQGAAEAAGPRAGPELLRDLSRALMATGRPLPALGAMERLVTDPALGPAERAESYWRYGRAAWLAGRLGDAEAHLAEAATLAAPGSGLAVTVLVDRALAAALHRGPRHALGLAEQALGRALPLDEALRRRAEAAQALITLAAGETAASGDQMGPGHLAPSILVDRDDNLPATAVLCGVAAIWTERFDDADRIFTGLAPEAAFEETTGPFLTRACGRLLLLVRRARFAEGLALVRETVAAGDRVPAVASWMALLEGYLLFETGQLTSALAARDQAAASAHDCFSQAFVGHLEGLELLRSGQMRAASDAYLRVEQLTSQAGVGEPCAIPWARHGIAAHLRADRLADARRLTDRLEEAAGRLPCRWPRAAAAFGRAGFAEAAGDREAAVAHYEAALKCVEPADLPAEKIELLIAYGASLRRAGRPAKARGALHEAVDTAESLGAVSLAGLARQELRLVGGRRRRHDDSRRLTPAEERVAALLVAGASNREIAGRLFVSEATVKSHVEHIFAKMGVHSRRQLIAGLPS